jgi:beta-lactamase class A
METGVMTLRYPYFFLLYLLISTSAYFCLAVAIPACAETGSGAYDVSYLWHTDLNSLFDYEGKVERVLGRAVKAKLQVVGKEGLYGLIYDQDGDKTAVRSVARVHSERLIHAGLEKAAAIKDKGYHVLYNVSYGVGPNSEALINDYQTVCRCLGADVDENLSVIKYDSSRYALVYRMRGDRDSTARIARGHARLLRKKGLSASIVREDNYDVVYAGATPLARREDEQVRAGAENSDDEDFNAAGDTAAAGAFSLEERLEQFVQEQRGKGIITRDETMGWLVYDITTGQRLVSINADTAMQSASMIKPLVALAFFHKAKKGKLIYGPKSRAKMESMIHYSSNSATNWLMRRCGGPNAVQHILRTDYGSLFRSTKIVEYIPCGGQTYRNRASAEDYNRFLCALWQDDLPFSGELRRLMALPGKDRLCYGTEVPQGTRVYNKTGTTAKLCGDMGIIVGQGRDGQIYPYIVVGIIEKKSRVRNYRRWKETRGDLIRQVSSMAYEDMKRRHKLL